LTTGTFSKISQNITALTSTEKTQNIRAILENSLITLLDETKTETEVSDKEILFRNGFFEQIFSKSNLANLPFEGNRKISEEQTREYIRSWIKDAPELVFQNLVRAGMITVEKNPELREQIEQVQKAQNILENVGRLNDMITERPELLDMMADNYIAEARFQAARRAVLAADPSRVPAEQLLIEQLTKNVNDITVLDMRVIGDPASGKLSSVGLREILQVYKAQGRKLHIVATDGTVNLNRLLKAEGLTQADIDSSVIFIEAPVQDVTAGRDISKVIIDRVRDTLPEAQRATAALRMIVFSADYATVWGNGNILRAQNIQHLQATRGAVLTQLFAVLNEMPLDKDGIIALYEKLGFNRADLEATLADYDPSQPLPPMPPGVMENLMKQFNNAAAQRKIEIAA
jgi:hypothetical protein